LLTPEQQDSLKSLLTAATKHNHGHKPQIVIASSADVEGQKFARQIMETCQDFVPTREVPPFGRDWARAVEFKEQSLVRSAGGPDRLRAPSMAVR